LRTSPAARLRYFSAMNTAELPDRESFSIADSSEILGLDSFSVYFLIHRRKLNADRTLLGELVISRNELAHVLGENAVFPNTSDVTEG
jgi:hypothetical protein